MPFILGLVIGVLLGLLVGWWLWARSAAARIAAAEADAAAARKQAADSAASATRLQGEVDRASSAAGASARDASATRSREEALATSVQDAEARAAAAEERATAAEHEAARLRTEVAAQRDAIDRLDRTAAAVGSSTDDAAPVAPLGFAAVPAADDAAGAEVAAPAEVAASSDDAPAAEPVAVAEPEAAMQPLTLVDAPSSASSASGASSDGDIETIEGIGPAYGARLRANGVATVAALLAEAAPAAGRARLAEATGIAAAMILTWVNHADLMRVAGVGPQEAELLEAAGIDSPLELARRNAANLAEALERANAEKRLVPSVPDADAVRGWVDAAKQLERVVSH